MRQSLLFCSSTKTKRAAEAALLFMARLPELRPDLRQNRCAFCSYGIQGFRIQTQSFAVGVANNLVNNLPSGLIAVGAIQAAHTKGLVANAVLIGVDL